MRARIENYIYNKVKCFGILKTALSFVYKIAIVNPQKKRTKLAYKNNAISVLSSAKKALDSNDIVFWLDFGTMLGAYRDKGFIAHDDDIDIAAFYSDYAKVKNAMESEGFHLKHQYKVEDEGMEQTYILDGVNIDVFFYKHENENRIFCNTFSMLENTYYGNLNMEYPALVKEIFIPFTGLEKIRFYNEWYKVPVNVKECLIAHYGADFMTPNPNFDYRKAARNIKYYSIEEKQGVYTKFLK